MTVSIANTQRELEEVFALRYKILRAPWNQPANTSSDELEAVSLNAFIKNEKAQVVACGRLQENANKVGQIRYMAVDEKYQGQGLGKIIVDFLEQEAKKKGFQVLELQARENAVKFYESQGYKVKEKTFLLWGMIQHYLMEKPIS
jgi:ribosomal protein S18 acetylase RimI-like enzyme